MKHCYTNAPWDTTKPLEFIVLLVAGHHDFDSSITWYEKEK